MTQLLNRFRPEWLNQVAPESSDLLEGCTLEFILFEVGHGPTRLIKDEEVVEVNDHSTFDAIPDDDHS